MWTIEQAAVELGVKGGLLRYWLEKLKLPTTPDADGAVLLDENGLTQLKLVSEWREEGLTFDEIRDQLIERPENSELAKPAFVVPPAQPALRLAMEIMHRHYEHTSGQHDRVYRDLLVAQREISDLRYRLGRAEVELAQVRAMAATPWYRRWFGAMPAAEPMAVPVVVAQQT